MENNVILVVKNPIDFTTKAYIVKDRKNIAIETFHFQKQNLEEEIAKLCDKYQIFTVQFAGPTNYISKFVKDIQQYTEKNNLNIQVIKEVYNGKVSFKHD